MRPINVVLSVIILLVYQVAIAIEGREIQEKEERLQQYSSDTTRLNLLLELGEHYCYSDARKAQLYLQEALVLSTQLNHNTGIAASLLWQGRAFYYQDEYDMATRFLEKARYYYESLQNPLGMIRYHIFTAAINKIIGNYVNALKNYQAAADLSQQTSDAKNLFLANCGMGSVHLERHEPKLAIEYFTRALALSTAIDDPGLLAILYSNIGKTHETLHIPDSAMYYYQMSLAKRKETGGIRGIASSEYQIGNLLIKMQQYQNALPLLSASKEKYITLKDDMGICINKIDMAAALYYLGRQQEAEDLTEKVFAMISQLENPNLLSRAYTNLAPALAATGNYKTSWQYLQENNHIRESLSLVNREKIIRELEVQFQTRQREEEIRMLQDLNQAQQKNIVLLYLLLAFLFALITLLFIMFRLKATSLKRKSELYEREKTIRQQETQLKEKQQQLLKEQLETKNRELASKALEMLRVNETLGDVIEKLGNLRTNVNGNEQITKILNSIVCGLEAQLKNNSWNEFEKIFTNIHSDFFNKLLSLCPDLTGTEIKIAALLKLNLNTKEIAAITFKSEAGIKSTRYRLRKKLTLDNDESLIPFLMKLS